MNKLILTLLFVGLMFIPLVNSIGIDPLKINEEGKLKQTCANCTYVNITAIEHPNQTIQYINVAMSKNVNVYTYSFIPYNYGTYTYYTIGNPNGVEVTQSVDFEVTLNGKKESEGIIVILFIICFLIILAYAILTFTNLLTHIGTWDYDLIDLAQAWGGYFAFIGLHQLHYYYVGNPLMDAILSFGLYVGGLTHAFIPLAMLFISIIFGSLKGIGGYK